MISEKAFAKFDLAIHINPKKNGGLYPVDYIDCQLDICDKLYFLPKQKDIEIVCDNADVPTNEDNFIYQAATLIKKIAGDESLGAKIVLKKQIPVKAGFGGGSSDGAAAVRGLSRLWKIKLSKKQILTIAKSLGKDFFYSMYGGLAEVAGEGKNYEMTPLPYSLPKFWLVVVVPFDAKPSTGWVYEHLRMKKIGRNFDKLERLKTAILKHDRMEILKNLTNDFETLILSSYPIVGEIKDDLKEAGAQAAIMAGAGLAVVGFFESRKRAEGAKDKLEKKAGVKKTFVSRIIS